MNTPVEDPAWNPSWKKRQRVIFGTLLFCAAVVLYITFENTGSRLHESIANSLIMLAGTVVGSYVFGAVWQDVKLRGTGS